MTSNKTDDNKKMYVVQIYNQDGSDYDTVDYVLSDSTPTASELAKHYGVDVLNKHDYYCWEIRKEYATVLGG